MRRVALIAPFVFAMFLSSAQTPAPKTLNWTESERRVILRLSPVSPPPDDATNRVARSEFAAEFGQQLFFDARLSASREVACATCHDPAQAFSDGKSLAQLTTPLTRNTPSLWNVAYQRWFFWDGRNDTLWGQALEPIEHPREMAFTRLEVAHAIAANSDLRRAYERAFGALDDCSDRTRFPARGRPALPFDGTLVPSFCADWQRMAVADQETINRVFANVGKSLAAYMTRLVRADAPFDTFVAGLRDNDATRIESLSLAAQRGLRLFIGRAGCRQCHSGPLFTDFEFHDIGLMTRDAASRTAVEPGRYDGIARARGNPFNSAGAHSDARDGKSARLLAGVVQASHQVGAFKTPSLRNVALTAPYMHQGQFATLAEVLHYYSTLEGARPREHHDEQVLTPLQLTDGERSDLIAFLESLTAPVADPGLLTPPKSQGDGTQDGEK
ncbi:MAG: cytochrome-c peroxidase [Planctomycetota bacterium]